MRDLKGDYSSPGRAHVLHLPLPLLLVKEGYVRLLGRCTLCCRWRSTLSSPRMGTCP
jgi:hypothetical protein